MSELQIKNNLENSKYSIKNFVFEDKKIWKKFAIWVKININMQMLQHTSTAIKVNNTVSISK